MTYHERWLISADNGRALIHTLNGAASLWLTRLGQELWLCDTGGSMRPVNPSHDERTGLTAWLQASHLEGRRAGRPVTRHG